MSEENTTLLPGIGLDCGTMNFVAARYQLGADGSKNILTSRMRDAFLDLPLDARKHLKLSKVNYVQVDDQLVVVGDKAMEYANVFGGTLRRPLKAGLISAGEMDAIKILGILIKHCLKSPQQQGEYCYFSIPAEPVDENRKVIYHKGILENIIQECGFTPVASNEAMAVIYSETAEDDFDGIGISFGSGMTNVALSVGAMEGLSFSIGRCLAGDFPVVTRHGLTTMEGIKEGDEVLDAHGQYVRVVEKMENGIREDLVEVKLENLPGFPHRMTRDHRVFVLRRFGWEWVEAGDLQEGDCVGVPTVGSERNSGSSYYFGRQNDKSITVAGARALGRLFGVFLGNGSCGPHAEDPSHVQFAFNRRDQHLVEKYAELCFRLFHREPEIVDDPAENITRVKLHITPVARHFKARFYDETGVKVCPLDPAKIGNQMALGILQGLLDSDSHEEPKRHTLTNTSIAVVMLAHHLLNRFGIEHSIAKREPRLGGVNARGLQIEGRKPCYEVLICGHVSKNLLDTMLAVEGNQVFDRFPDFALYRVRSVTRINQSTPVYDLRVASEHHSFSSPGMVVHNCGDWIDEHAAASIDSTPSRICAIKESGIDLMNPKTREEETLAIHYKHHIEYVLDQFLKQFVAIKDKFAIPRPIPIVVSGGTSKAGGFLEFFQQTFESNRRKFPIEIKEIRAASDPLNAVAQGLLVQAALEYDEDDED